MPSVINHLEQLREAIRDVEIESAADVFLYSGIIDDDGAERLCTLATTPYGRSANVILCLTTFGGDPDCAYRIARCLQRSYSDGKVVLFVIDSCKSAGTLIAIGADELVMGEMSELGPLDVQLTKPDALFERTSGLTPGQALNTLQKRAYETMRHTFWDLRIGSMGQITTRTALDVATQLTTGLFSGIYGQIDPMRLGEISRSMDIAKQYGTRLARGNAKEDSIRHLIEDYPSHGFVIECGEARELFEVVSPPTEKQVVLSHFVRPYVEKGMTGESAVVEFLSVLAKNNLEREGEENDTVGKQTEDDGGLQARGGSSCPRASTSDHNPSQGESTDGRGSHDDSAAGNEASREELLMQ